ncbi:CHAT domain-containing protein [Streptomyces sp. NPDC004610]|uniref:CHAT domain-containing protein n=1 Tax=unclassified Streptomyces TaxID=2593676 RepID=UPI0033B2A164
MPRRCRSGPPAHARRDPLIPRTHPCQPAHAGRRSEPLPRRAGRRGATTNRRGVDRSRSRRSVERRHRTSRAARSSARAVLGMFSRSLGHAASRSSPYAWLCIALAPPVLAVLPTTPNLPDLPGVTAETTPLTRHRPGSRVLTSDKAVRRTVLAALSDHLWLHFGRQTISDTDALDGSRMLLHDHLEHPRSLPDIAPLHLRDAWLADLSVCETTQAHRALADESVHLTDSFLIAGHKHVVGTL